ncbi:GGDEF domain-containing protein [Marinicella gelatinilytica]|uniref:GGDEF domain-containing protein n=1 Tax=Marinicella gelatinilytica TaxID=2996017 RepID=UPI002260D620|nr:GGDEF domain-containing protein [Marinicella gelatinilytica]MCX7545425.1 diguanylate cyclase [Marinicella gelatinilytica]
MKAQYFISFSSLCLLFFLQFSLAQPSTQILSPEYEDLYTRISDNPQLVVDELLANPPNQPQSELAAQYHYILSEAYLSLVYPQQALEAANKALHLLPEKQPDSLYHALLITKAQALDLKNQSQEGLPLVKQALQWAESNHNQNMIINALVAQGYLEITLGNYITALEALLRAYHMAPHSGSTNSKSAIAGSVALVYEYRREDQLAIPYFQEAVDYQRQNNNQLELSIALYGLGRANKNIGKLETGQKQLQESLAISRAIGDDQGVAYALKELAPLYIKSEDFEQASLMLTEAARLFSGSQNKFMLLDIHSTLTQLYLKMDDKPKSLHHMKLAKKYLDADSMPVQAISLAELESEVKAQQGFYQQAYEQLKSTIHKKQQLMSKRSAQKLHELRVKFESETQAKENSILAKENAEQKLQLVKEEQQNQRLMMGIFAAVSLVFLLIFAVIYNKKQQAKLYQLANFDQLTGLFNRSHIMTLLKQIHARLKTNQSIHLVMLDLDNFKQINDQFGHDAGDQVLIQLGQLCQQHITAPNLAGRFGGEEFLLVLVDSNTDQVSKKIETLRIQAQHINTTIHPECPPIHFSAGLSECRYNQVITECIKCADLAMYQAKNSGRNRTVVSSLKL